MFNFLEYPTDVVLLVVLWRLRYKLSLRDLAEMFLERGWAFTYEAVREWERRFAPLITEQLWTKRCEQAGQSWYVDDTYVKVRGKWCHLYHVIDTDGNPVDSRLSEKRDMDAADELRDYFRPRHTERETMSPAQQRRIFHERFVALQELMIAVS